MNIENAKIESTQLGLDDRGCFTCWLQLSYGGAGQGFGGYSLQGKYASIWIKKILDIVGVDKWEKLPGEYVRVKRGDGFNGFILAIGNVLEDKWFEPKEEFKTQQRTNN